MSFDDWCRTAAEQYEGHTQYFQDAATAFLSRLLTCLSPIASMLGQVFDTDGVDGNSSSIRSDLCVLSFKSR
ncbi:hypothetical protein PsorP6_001679 [Peronosclerospora sorghi]|uniref:Uncharacterized protein n=1 Tax=Peronosclerospora sorghi TaxID=230839 RepID=A0ACC0WWZ5_9STRA|nr:hypothetical protein PsorP6_001679 [Peronosclerospora sorghi]